MAYTVEEFRRLMENRCIKCGAPLIPNNEDDDFHCSSCHYHHPSCSQYVPASTPKPEKHLGRYELLKKKD